MIVAGCAGAPGDGDGLAASRPNAASGASNDVVAMRARTALVQLDREDARVVEHFRAGFCVLFGGAVAPRARGAGGGDGGARLLEHRIGDAARGAARAIVLDRGVKRQARTLRVVLLLLGIAVERGVDVRIGDGQRFVDRLALHHLDEQRARRRSETAAGGEVRHVLGDVARSDLQEERVQIAARVAEVIALRGRILHRPESGAVLDELLKLREIHSNGAPPRAARPPRIAWGPRSDLAPTCCGAADPAALGPSPNFPLLAPSPLYRIPQARAASATLISNRHSAPPVAMLSTCFASPGTTDSRIVWIALHASGFSPTTEAYGQLCSCRTSMPRSVFWTSAATPDARSAETTAAMRSSAGFSATSSLRRSAARRPMRSKTACTASAPPASRISRSTAFSILS